MQNFLLPIILLAASGGILFTITRDQYNQYNTNAAQVIQLDEALEKFTELDLIKKERVERKSKISTAALEKLENGMLSDTVDTIRLTMDIQGIASQNGILIKKIDIKKDEAVAEGIKNAQTQASVDNPDAGQVVAVSNANAKKYGVLSISFAVTSTYDDFKKFLLDLERSLRVMDLMSLKVSTGGGAGTGQETKKIAGQTAYDFSVQAQTYWLK